MISERLATRKSPLAQGAYAQRARAEEIILKKSEKKELISFLDVALERM